MPTRSSISTARSRACRFVPAPWARIVSMIWSPIVNDGIEARHRLLEDHRHVPAADAAHLALAAASSRSARRAATRPRRDRRRRRQQPHQARAPSSSCRSRSRRRGRGSRPAERERDVVDGCERALRGARISVVSPSTTSRSEPAGAAAAEAVRVGSVAGHQYRRSRGSKMSRRPSPSEFRPEHDQRDHDARDDRPATTDTSSSCDPPRSSARGSASAAGRRGR